MRGELRRLYDRARILGGMLAIRACRRQPYPFYINLIINSRCTLRCAYCFGRYPDRRHTDMPLARFRETVDLLRAHDTRFIILQGGEPLLHPDLGAMLAYLRRCGIVSGISTNGQLPERIRELPELDLMDNICFSLDGAAPGNDRVRGSGCYDRVMDSIDAVRRYRHIPIRINTTVHRFVLDDVHHLAELVRRERLEWGVSLLFLGDEQAGDDALNPGEEDVRAYLRTVLDYKRRGYPIFTSSRALRYALDWPVPYSRRYLTADECRSLPDFSAIICQYGRYEAVVDEDGSLYPCNAWQGRFAAGNVERDDFAAAYARLAAKPCATCFIPPLINTSAMINWDIAVIAETVADTVRSRFRRRA